MIINNSKVSLMQIQFIRNIQFTKLVKAEGRLREFNFRKSNGLQEGLFTVDVSDDRGNRIVLRMQREDGVWKIVKQQLPTWTWENESVLHTIRRRAGRRRDRKITPAPLPPFTLHIELPFIRLGELMT